MMPRMSGLFAASLLLVVAAACAQDSTTCKLDTGESDSVGGMVSYRAESTGDATVSMLTLATDSGLQVVANPGLPYMQTVTLATAHAQIQATGSVTNGSFTIAYSASGGPEQQQAMCSASN
jgi:hypothetical protein